MAVRRRLAAFAFLPILLTLAVATSQVTASAFNPAGNYRHTGMLGSFNYFDPATNLNFNFFANRNETVGPSGTTDQTNAFLNVSANDGSLNINCFVNDSSNEFNVASDVSSASYHVTIPANDPACDYPVDLAIDITWSGAGPIQSTTTTTQSMCAGYTDETQGNDSNNAGPATFSIQGLVGPVTATNPQVFHFSSSLEHIQGAIPPDTCRVSLGFKGAGRETPAAGTYRKTTQTAQEFAFSPTFLFLDAERVTSMSNPLGGSLTTSSQTTFLNTAGGGCYVINGGDYTFGGSSANVNTNLTGNISTPACGGGTNFPSPDPFATVATWVQSGPVLTTRTVTQYACLNYHFQINEVDTANQATVTVTMPGFSGALSDPGVVGSTDKRTHADGTPAAGCFFRG